MVRINLIHVGKDAVDQLVNYASSREIKRLVIVADANTFQALGERVELVLKENGFDVNSIVLEGDLIHADEHQLVQVLIRAPLGPCTFIAVGSGTITDITRFASHRTGRTFIGMPTAPSVDGFTSIGAPIILAGVKTTIICQPPEAVFADMDTLCQAPQRLVASGYSDMIGKITSLADWRLGNLLWDEPYDEDIAMRSQAAINSVIAHAASIGERTEQGIQALMDALIESGLCMLDFGDSRPASGAEHHASHFWEMKRLREGRETQLHGAQVGFALTVVAAQYAKIRAISYQEMMSRLEEALLPARQDELTAIREGYGDLAQGVIKAHLPFLDLTPDGFELLKRRIAANWDAIQDIARNVPSPEVIADLLRQAGAPADHVALGLDADEVQPGFQYGHYLRNRFTVLKLSRVLGIPLG